MPSLRKLGTWAEDRAAQYLLDLGYILLTRRYRTRSGELDIVALDGEILVFVEVKYRRSKSYPAEESMSERKIKNIRSAAEEYLVKFDASNRIVRFDFVAIDDKGLRHYEDAFR